MKTAILYVSVHHGNTRKVAAAMAQACSAELIDLTAQAAVTISDYDRIGLASGCFYGNMHETLRQFVEKTDFPAEQEVFLVCTCGCVYRDYTKAVKKMLQEKGVTVSASFQCRGFDTFGPFGKIGGIAKGHPNERDLEKATAFIKRMR